MKEGKNVSLFFHLFFKKKQETAFFFIFAEKTQLIAS